MLTAGFVDNRDSGPTLTESTYQFVLVVEFQDMVVRLYQPEPLGLELPQSGV